MKDSTINYDTRLLILASILMLTANLGFLKAGPLSISFFFGAIFIILVYFSFPKYAIIKGDMRSLMIVVALSLISLILSPVGFDGSSVFSGFQIVYWFILAVIFSNICKIIETRFFSICVVVAIFIICSSFLLISGENDFFTENTASCIVVTLWPFGLYLFKKKIRLLYILYIFFALLVIGSRTGIILVLLQMIIFYFIRRISAKQMVASLIIIAGVSYLLTLENVRLKIAEVVFPEDRSMQILIETPEIAFQMDKSWVQRRIQQEKCKQVMSMFPVFGIGPLNYEKYNINIDISKITDVDDARLKNQLMYSDNRSTHNSYYQLLAENGILVFLIVISIILGILIKLFGKRKEGEIIIILLISSFGLFSNLFMLSGFWGTNTWLLIGIFKGYTRSTRSLNNLQI